MKTAKNKGEEGRGKKRTHKGNYSNLRGKEKEGVKKQEKSEKKRENENDQNIKIDIVK